MNVMGEPGLPGTRGRLEHGIEALLPPARQRPTPPTPVGLPTDGRMLGSKRALKTPWELPNNYTPPSASSNPSPS